MANVLTTHGVLVLDTAAIISATAKFKIKKIVLVGGHSGAGAAGDNATLEDGTGALIAKVQVPVAKGVDEVDFGIDGLFVTGLELATISSAGLVFVYCG